MSAGRRFPWLIHAGIVVLIIIVALLPLFSVLFAGLVADSAGCGLHEGFAQPCMINGEDWGELLYTLFVLGWLMLATIPLGLMALIVWTVVIIVHFILWRRKRGAQP